MKIKKPSGKNKKFLIVSCSIILFSFIVGSVFSAGLGGLEIKPAFPDESVPNSESWFTKSTDVGESWESAVAISNSEEDSVSLSLYAADAKSGESGEFTIEKAEDEKNEVGSWIKFYPENPPTLFSKIFSNEEKKVASLCGVSREDLEEEVASSNTGDEVEEIAQVVQFEALEKWCEGIETSDLDLESEGSISIPFVVNIPEDAPGGEYAGSILIQKKDEDGELGDRVGVRIYQTIIAEEEPVSKLSLGEFKVTNGKGLVIQWSLVNEGNTDIEYDATINIKETLLKKTDEGIEQVGVISAGETSEANYSWIAPIFGKFELSLEVKYHMSEDEIETLITDTVTIWVIPYKEISIVLIGFIVVAVAYYFARKYLKSRQKTTMNWVEYEVQEGDDIESLAQEHNVSWREIAKNNSLKPPYNIDPGQVIKIPPFDEEFASEMMGLDNISGSLGDEISDIQEEMEDKKEKKKGKNILKKLVSWIATLAVLGGAIGFVYYAVETKIKTPPKKQGESIESIAKNDVPIQEAESVAVETEEKKDETTVVVEESIKEEAPVEKTETTETKKNVEIKILNGGAAAGEAGKMKEFLEGKDYSSVTAENASSSNYSGITVYYKEDFKEEALDISAILLEEYEGVTVKKGVTTEQTSSEIVIIMGS